MMACDGSNRKCFTFIWKLENVSYCMSNDDENVSYCMSNENFVSPKFVVSEIHETDWTLEIYFSNDNRGGFIELDLLRHDANETAGDVEIDCEFAFLSSDGRVLHSREDKNVVISENDYFRTSDFISRNEVFVARRSDFLPHDTLTARCRMWKSDGEMSKDVQCFARSRVAVEKRSFLWNIENFSILKCNEMQTYKITSIGSDKELMSLKLFLAGRRISDEIIRVKIIPNFQNIKVSTIKLSILDASKNSVKCFHDEFWHTDACKGDKYYDSKDFILFLTKRELLENKSTYLPNDILSLRCECTFSCGTVSEEIEMANFDCSAVAKKGSDSQSLNKANSIPVSCCVLRDNLKSLLNNSSLSDVKLRTKSQTYPAHMSILGARSPVFNAMFSNNMKEKIKEWVDIEDLNDGTLVRLLRYIYSAEVEELDWVTATELYEAADKYQIPSLKDICSSYIKRNLCANNSCDALVLADLHQDEDLKGCIQDYILRHGKEIINSADWDQLMKTNVNLAAETMRMKYTMNL